MTGNEAGLIIAVVDGNREYMKSVQEFAELRHGIERCDTYRLAKDFLTALRAGLEYQVVILNAYLPDMSPLEFLHEFGKLNCYSKPLILVTTLMPDCILAQNLQAAGADLIIPKPEKLSQLLDAAAGLAMEPEHYIHAQLQEQIWWVLHNTGIPTCDGGYDYLFKAIEYSFQSGMNRAVTKEIYPQIAEEFDVSTHAVDSGLRRITEKYLPKNGNQYQELAVEAGLKEGENLSNTKLVRALTKRVVLRMGRMGRQYTEMRGI